jgi:DNA-binding CsgD family transcriptional regulator
MPRKRDTTINESLEELQTLEKRYRGKPEAVRIAVLRLMKEDEKRGIEDVALLAGVSTPTVKRWWRAYREGGVETMMKPVGRVQSEQRDQGLESIKRKLVSGEIQTLDDLWNTVSVLREQSHRTARPNSKAVRSPVLPQATHNPTYPITVESLFRFITSLPISHDIQEWADGFRKALQELLLDVDRVSMTVNLSCDLVNPERYKPSIVVSQSLARGNKAISPVPDHDDTGNEHLERFMQNLRRSNFPFDEYRKPHSFVYYYHKHAYLGIILIWRRRDRTALSEETIRVMERLRGFFELLLSDIVARNEIAKPVANAFSMALEDLTVQTGLTVQEQRILVLQLLGFSYEEVAETINISLNTVRYHLRSIYAKTDTHSQAELFAKYFTPRVGPPQVSE